MTVTAPSSLNPPPGARPATRPAGRLASRLVELARALHHDQYQLVLTAAAFADSGEWAAEGATSAGAWLADMADVEPCTAREWIRIGRQLNQLPVMWRNRHHTGAEIDTYHHQHRSVRWRTGPDGMVTFTIRLPHTWPPPSSPC